MRRISPRLRVIISSRISPSSMSLALSCRSMKASWIIMKCMKCVRLSSELKSLLSFPIFLFNKFCQVKLGKTINHSMLQSDTFANLSLAETKKKQTTHFKCHIVRNGRSFLIFCSIQILKVNSLEKLWEQILPHRDKKHDQQWEKDPSYRNPC